MSVPAALLADLAAFREAVASARPLASASPLAVAELIRLGNGLIADMDAAIEAAGLPLDGQEPSGHPTAMVAAVRGFVQASADQVALHDARGALGRAVLNLAQGIA